MVNHLLMLSKVIGTVSLGILAGSTITTGYVVLPGLSQATDGGAVEASILNTIYNKWTKFVNWTSITAFITLSGSYVFASPKAQHPYLIYSALSIPLLRLMSYLGAIHDNTRLQQQRARDNRRDTYDDNSSSSSSVSLEDAQKKPISFKEHDEPSMLGDSVYAHVLSEEGSDSDKGELPDKDQKTINNSSSSKGNRRLNNEETISHSTSSADEFKTNYAHMRKGSLAAAIVYSLAFAISTVGIYGDMA